MRPSNVYTIHDSKAEYYKPPFVARSKGEALRMFQQAANDKQTEIGNHPEDFTLYQIGTYNDLTGQIMSESHISLGKAIEYVRKEPSQTIRSV